MSVLSQNSFSMNRAYYSFAIFVTALAFFISLVQSLFYFQIGRPVYTLQSFSSLYTLTMVITLAASLVILKYYHFKQYQLAFGGGIVATVTQTCFALLVYGTMRGMDWGQYYLPTYMVSLGAGILYAVTLVLAPAGKRPWLRITGSLMLIIGSILLVAVASFALQRLNFVEVESIHQWTSLVTMLLPGFFMINFFAELKHLREERAGTLRSKPLETTMKVAGLVMLLFTLFVTARFSMEGLGAVAWSMQAPERIKRLAEPFEARTYVSPTRGTLLYRFMRPADYDSTQSYPIVICLHHGGTHGNDNMKQIDGSPIAQVLSADGNRQKYPAFLFVPQSPEGVGWGGVATLPSIDSLVFEGLKAFEKEFSIDKGRRYVIGISGGGYGSWHFICSRPEMFAAAVPICGGTDPQLAPKIADVPVWAFHGAQDRNVPVRHSRDMIEAIKNAGGDPRYTEFPDHAHNIWPQVIQTEGLLEWMFAQRRN